MQTIIDQYTPVNVDGMAGRCNAILNNCKNPFCDYHYPNKELTECPECGTIRERCSQYPTKGKEKCRYHGGHAATGLASTNHQGHGLSKSIPTRFLDKYAMHYQDPDILNMVDDIAILKMRRDNLLEKLDQLPVADNQWVELRDKFERLQYHMEQQHINKIDEMMWALGKIIADGYQSVLIWQELENTIEASRKVRDSEIKRRKIAQTIITEQQFHRVIGFIMSVIQNRVKDPIALSGIMRDLETLNVRS